ncbi:MAG: hypothetical protein RMY29_011985 [Nostoc sp. CreGUA01]|nr:hypothetical protein [Nostoc sp. CreGUA01]
MVANESKKLSGQFQADLTFPSPVERSENSGQESMTARVVIAYDHPKLRNKLDNSIALLVADRGELDDDGQPKDPKLLGTFVTGKQKTSESGGSQFFEALADYPYKIKLGNNVSVTNLKLELTYSTSDDSAPMANDYQNILTGTSDQKKGSSADLPGSGGGGAPPPAEP